MKRSLYTRFQNYMMHLGNVKTRRILLQLDQRTLEDAGLSRDLLEQGVSAWPWRIEEAAEVPRQQVEAAPIQRDVANPLVADDHIKHAA